MFRRNNDLSLLRKRHLFTNSLLSHSNSVGTDVMWKIWTVMMITTWNEAVVNPAIQSNPRQAQPQCLGASRAEIQLHLVDPVPCAVKASTATALESPDHHTLRPRQKRKIAIHLRHVLEHLRLITAWKSCQPDSIKTPDASLREEKILFGGWCRGFSEGKWRRVIDGHFQQA